MSTTGTVTTAPGGRIDGLARAVQWAHLLVNAAIPLEEDLLSDIRADRSQLRLEAFRQVLAKLAEGGWTARPSDLGRLTAGQMPESRS